MDPLNDKIVTIIEALGFSNTKFADAISVSRPTISHIISGRNKPSIDIVQKILVKYPELGYKWFLDDEELDLGKLSKLANSHSDLQHGTQSDEPNERSPDTNMQLKNSTQTVSVQKPPVTESDNLRRVERVIMFYSDGSMEVLSGAPQVL